MSPIEREILTHACAKTLRVFLGGSCRGGFVFLECPACLCFLNISLALGESDCAIRTAL